MNYFSSTSKTPTPPPSKSDPEDDQGISGMIAGYSKQIYETANGFYDDVYQRMFTGSEASNSSGTLPPADKNAQSNQGYYAQRGYPTTNTEARSVNYYQASTPSYQQSQYNGYSGSQPRIYTPERGYQQQQQQYYAQSDRSYMYPSSNRSQAHYANKHSKERMADLKKEIQYLDETDSRERHGKKRQCCCCPTSRRGKWICWLSILVVLSIIGVFMFFYFPRYCFASNCLKDDTALTMADHRHLKSWV